LLACAFVAAITARVHAQAILPQGGTVASGQVRIGTPTGNTLTINQSSSKAIVDWNSFSVGADASVNFVQPNSGAAILNRVTGATPSTIAGQINANGQVFLVNPNGIAITPTGSVQVGGGFVASTLDIGNADFNAGILNFAGKGASAAVSNAGRISGTPGSFVGLIGGSVSNSGTISVPLGKVGLGAGEKVTLDPTGDGFLQVTVPTGATTANGQALIDVGGRIRATGGSVEIKAATAQQAVRDVVNVSGSIGARSVRGHSGNIVLDGGSGTVTVSGTLAANGGTRSKGGTVVVTGNKVALTSTAKVTANGSSGGSVLIGGDLRGGIDPSAKLVAAPVRTAATTSIEKGATISANGSSGDGGNAVVWSDTLTDFRGSITATGGGTGNGGAVEVSSHGMLGFAGSVDVTATSGRTGTLLLDPFDVTISSGSDSNISNSSNTFSPTGNSSILSVTTLQNALATANVTVNTGSSGAQAGDITVSNAVSWSSGNTLALTAAGAVNVNAAISATNGGSLSMTGSTISVSATSITLDGTLTATATASGATTAVSLSNATISVGSGASTISGTSFTGFGVNFVGSSNLTAGGGGTLTIGGTNTGSAVLAATQFASNANLTTAGSVTLNGTSSSFVGVQLAGGNTLTVSSGNLTMNGTATSDSGLQLRGTDTLTNSGAGLLSLVGSSNTSRGAEIFASANVTVAGNASLSGTSVSGTGMIFNNASATTVTGGNLTVNGVSTSTSGTGSTLGTRFATASLVNSGSGAVIITGTSDDTAAANNGSAGVLVTGASALTNSGSGTLSVSGVNTSGYGLQLKTGAALTTSGTMSIGGTTGAGYGVLASTASITSTGALTVNGTSSSLVGTLFNGGVTLTASSGDLTVNGTSSTSNAGLQLRGTDTITNSGAGLLSLNGSSSTYRGVEVFAGANLTISGNTSLSGTAATGIGVLFGTSSVTSVAAGNFTVNGLSSSTSGTTGTIGTLLSDASLTNSGSGAVNVTGTSEDAGTANSGSAGTLLLGANSLTNSGSGTFSISGLNTSGYGAQIKSSATLATSGTMSIAGTSNTGYGFYLGGTNTVTASSGNLSLSGSSTANLGMELLGTSTVTNNGSGTLALNATGGADLHASVSSSNGDLKLSGTGAFSQAAGTITAGNLLLTSASGSFSLGQANMVGTLAANAGSVSFVNNQNLTIGTVQATAGITATGAATVQAAGSLTIAPGAPISAASPVLSTTGAFINNAGSAAVTATSGRWLIYSNTPAGDSFGGLDSSNTAIWNATYATLPPGSLSAAGNRYLFANQPTLTFTSMNATKTYGTDATAAVASDYSVSGYQNGVSNAFLGDNAAATFTGGPSVTSTGAAATASVVGSPYVMTIAQGSLAAISGYAFAFSSPGTLTVNPAPVTVTALGGSSTYGSSPANPGLSATGLQNGQSVSALTGLSNSFGITNASNAGSYLLSVVGTLTNGNYTLAGTSNGSWTVNPAPVTVTALGGSSTYGASPANPGLSATGLQNGQSASVLTGLSNSFGITSTSPIGSYVLSVVGTLTNGNYTVVGSNSGTWNVTALRGSISDGTPPFNGPSPSDPNMLVAAPSGGSGNSALNGLANSSSSVNSGAASGAKSSAAGAGGRNASVNPGLLAAPGPSSPPASPPQSNLLAAPPAPAPVSTVPAGSANANSALQGGCGGKAGGSGNAAADAGGCAAQSLPKKADDVMDFVLSRLNRDALAQAIGEQFSEIARSESTPRQVLMISFASAGVALTVGFVGWLLRGGALLSALLSSMPLWRGFDPLVIVQRPSRNNGGRRIISRLDTLFDGTGVVNESAGRPRA